MRRLMVIVFALLSLVFVPLAAAQEATPAATEEAQTDHTPAVTPEATPAVTAEQTPAAENTARDDQYVNAPHQVRTSFQVIRVEPLDISTGSFVVDFYLDLACVSPSACTSDDLKFEVMNGTVISQGDPTWDNPDNPTEVTYRVLASIKEDINLTSYPFDSHDLTIKIENPIWGKLEVVFVPDTQSGVDSDVHVLGWDLDKNSESTVVDKYYNLWDVTYSRAIFTMHIHKAVLAGVLKGLIPGFLIIIGSLLTLLMSHEDAMSRITINSGTLVAAIFYHNSLTAPLPPVGYVLYADAHVVVIYLTIIASVALGVAMLLLNRRNRQQTSRRLGHIALYTVPIAYVVMETIVALWLLH